MEIKLGSKVKDTVTGFKGIAVSKVEYINGCVQYGVVPKTKDNSQPQVEYIDYQQLAVLSKPKKIKSSDTGGPQSYKPKS